MDPETGEPPNGYSNQCAIKVGVALTKSGVSLEVFNGDGYIRLDGEKIPIRAQEFSEWLNTSPVEGIGKPEDITGKDWADKISNRKGIVYFEDYWVRSNGQRSGDHIDLWNGSRMTALSSWIRVQAGVSWDGYWSDYSRSTTIKFYPVK